MKYELLEDKDWGMRWARPPVAQVMPVPEVYVHHTAGQDPADPPLYDDDAATAFRALNEAAINSKGYSATDYSMLVHTSPERRTTIGEARGQWTPAATLDRNRVSKAVCLFGYFHPPNPNQAWTKEASREPFDEELEAIAEAIVWMVEQGWVVRDPVIRGHRDNPAHPNATACPGDFLNSKLWIVRAAVTKMLSTPVPAPDDGDHMIEHDKPMRIFSTRPADGANQTGPPIPKGGGEVTVNVPFGGGIRKVRAQITVVPIEPNGFFRVSRPAVDVKSLVHSNGNWSGGFVESSPVVVAVDNSAFKVYCSAGTNLIVDWLGYEPA